jgi:hypothetical protein
MLNKIRDLGLQTIVVSPLTKLEQSSVLTDSADVCLNWNDITEASFCSPSESSPSASQCDRHISRNSSPNEVELPASATKLRESTLEFEDAQLANVAEHGSSIQSAASGKDKTWSDMTASEQHAAATLGYSAVSWDAGETPLRCELMWAALHEQERRAAVVLGYSPLEWDAELEAFSPSSGCRPDTLSLNATSPDVAQIIGHDGESHSDASSDVLELLADDIELGLVSSPQSKKPLSNASMRITEDKDVSQGAANPLRPSSEESVNDALLHRFLHGR